MVLPQKVLEKEKAIWVGWLNDLRKIYNKENRDHLSYKLSEKQLNKCIQELNKAIQILNAS